MEQCGTNHPRTIGTLAPGLLGQVLLVVIGIQSAQNLRGSLSCQKVTQVELGGYCWRILPE